MTENKENPFLPESVSLVKLADEAEKAVTRRDFLSEVVKKVRRSPGELEIRPSLPSVVAIGGLQNWVDKASDPEVRKKRGVIAVALTVGVTAIAGLSLHFAGKKKDISEKIERDREANLLPEEQKERLEGRKKLAESTVFDNYQHGTDYSIYPENIKGAAVQLFTSLIGPSWMFEQGAKEALRKTFGRDFTDEEISEFQRLPRKDREIVEMLDRLVKQGKVKKEVADFYRRSLTEEGRAAILADHVSTYASVKDNS